MLSFVFFLIFWTYILLKLIWSFSNQEEVEVEIEAEVYLTKSPMDRFKMFLKPGITSNLENSKK